MDKTEQESEMSIEDVKSKNDTNKDPDFIFCDGDQSKNGLRAATLEKLVEFCVCEFDFGANDTAQDPTLSNAVFMTHKWFISSEELLKMFVDQFWMSRYGGDFKKNQELFALLSKFQETVESEGDELDVSKMYIEEIRNRAFSAVAVGENRLAGQRKSSLAFKDISANMIAEQLTYLEYRMLRRIPFSEWRTYVCSGKLKDTTYLERYVALFNGVSRWVQGMVLNFVTPQERADCIIKFQETAKRLKELQNFNGLMAVAGGLTNSVLSRLHRTQEHVTRDCKEYLKLLMEFLSSDGNYATYRKRLSDCRGFLLPILGIQLKDLIAIHTAIPDTINGRLLNIQKMMRLSNIMSWLLVVQVTPPPVQANSELMNMLRVSLQPRLTEEDLYELSLAREPRHSSFSSCASLRSEDSVVHQSVMFADWVAGLLHTPPDRLTTERHVSAMVEAVFRIYDTDKDGSISMDEFDAIATNFPFIDSFGVLDINSDGAISRDEMKNYFMKANCHELSRGFSHNFQETTYFTPTFCDHCAGMLWGIIKQGHRCRDCHINCHKNCSGEIVRECRTKSPTTLNSAIDRSLHKAELLRTKWKNKIKVHKQLSAEDSSNRECISVPVELYNRLLQSEQSREQVMAENVRLHSELQETSRKLDFLQNHLNNLRQTTVTFILEQMDALQMQKDTEV